jgi:hypothetical protein
MALFAPEQCAGQETYSDDFFCEILWSYRVIFSQNKMSWQDFRRLYNKSSPAFHPNPNNTQAIDQTNSDPILRRLLTHGWRRSTSSTMVSLFSDLSAPPFKVVYSARADFPYLGRKLLVLQDYMNAQNPNDLRTLLYDRRDVLRFWTFWAVVLIGGTSILLTFLQLLFSAVQVAGQFTTCVV